MRVLAFRKRQRRLKRKGAWRWNKPKVGCIGRFTTKHGQRKQKLFHSMKKRTVRPNTVRNYTERYEHNIDPVIGKLILSEGKTDSMPDGYEPDDRRRISYIYYLSGKDTPLYTEGSIV